MERNKSWHHAKLATVLSEWRPTPASTPSLRVLSLSAVMIITALKLKGCGDT